jgi:hypothetical protein
MGMMDFSDKYNTALSPKEEMQFREWAVGESKRQGRDILMDLADYDVRGFWKDRQTVDSRGHGSDRFKKPNHPTFSQGSQYNGVEGMMGGRWDVTPDGKDEFFVGPSNMWSPEDLKAYFNDVEPGVELIFGAPLRGY